MLASRGSFSLTNRKRPDPFRREDSYLGYKRPRIWVNLRCIEKKPENRDGLSLIFPYECSCQAKPYGLLHALRTAR